MIEKVNYSPEDLIEIEKSREKFFEKEIKLLMVDVIKFINYLDIKKNKPVSFERLEELTEQIWRWFKVNQDWLDYMTENSFIMKSFKIEYNKYRFLLAQASANPENDQMSKAMIYQLNLMHQLMYIMYHLRTDKKYIEYYFKDRPNKEIWFKSYLLHTNNPQ